MSRPRRKITVSLDPASIDNAIRELNDYKTWLQEKSREFLVELAREGVTAASIRFQHATIDGPNDVRVEWEDRGDTTVAIVARGKTVLFIEFGSGVRYPTAYPEMVDPSKTLPGTWSESELGKGHWDDPKGWFYTHGKRSFGNPSNACMYQAKRDLMDRFERIARRVFA